MRASDERETRGPRRDRFRRTDLPELFGGLSQKSHAQYCKSNASQPRKHSGSNAKNPRARQSLHSGLAEKAGMRYTEIGTFHANTRLTSIACPKPMNSLRLALTVGFLSIICPVLAGAGPELSQPA